LARSPLLLTLTVWWDLERGGGGSKARLTNVKARLPPPVPARNCRSSVRETGL